MKKIGFAVWTVKDVAQERIRGRRRGSCTATMAVLSFDPLFESAINGRPAEGAIVRIRFPTPLQLTELP
jgi:hypothetical protein